MNDLMKSRVAELEVAEQKARNQIETLKSDLSQYQSRENELYRKIDRLKDELVDSYKIRHSRSPSNASRAGGSDHEESAAKRRKVLVSDLVDEKAPLESTTSLLPNGATEVKSEEEVAVRSEKVVTPDAVKN